MNRENNSRSLALQFLYSNQIAQWQGCPFCQYTLDSLPNYQAHRYWFKYEIYFFIDPYTRKLSTIGHENHCFKGSGRGRDGEIRLQRNQRGEISYFGPQFHFYFHSASLQGQLNFHPVSSLLSLAFWLDQVHFHSTSLHCRGDPAESPLFSLCLNLLVGLWIFSLSPSACMMNSIFTQLELLGYFLVSLPPGCRTECQSDFLCLSHYRQTWATPCPFWQPKRIQLRSCMIFYFSWSGPHMTEESIAIMQCIICINN